MKQTLRRFVPLAVVASMVVAGVLLASRPWSDGEEVLQEPAGATIRYRLCDVVLEALPPAVPEPGQEWLVVGRAVSAEFFEPTLELQPTLDLQIRGAIRSEVSIDPTTGTVLWERYGTPSQEATLQGILETLRVEPLDPATAPWPYTDTTQAPAERVNSGLFKYRPPDPGSGIVVSKMTADGLGWFSEHLTVANCRSVMDIGIKFPLGAEPEVTVTRDIHPDDEAAFQTFFNEVTPGEGAEQ